MAAPPDYSSPQACHTRLVLAVKGKDVAQFLMAFHPEALTKMFPDMDSAQREEAAQPIVERLHGLFEHHGYPVLGKETQGSDWMKVFEYFDHSNPQNRWATFALDPGTNRWLLMD